MGEQYPEVKHVVLDEVQCFKSEDGDWLGKARTIVRQHSWKGEDVLDGDTNLNPEQDLDSGFHSAPKSYPNMNLDEDTNSDDNQGFLWLFIDNDQVNHSFPTGIPHKQRQKPFFTLKKVIRNSKSIFDYAKSFLPRYRHDDREIGHDFKGEKEVEISYSKGKQLVALKGVLKNLFEKGYSQGEIAILYAKVESNPNYVCTELKLKHIVDAEENHRPFVLVSTFRKYSGLERPVIILVDFSSLEGSYSCNVAASMYCAVTRAMVKLIRLDEKP